MITFYIKAFIQDNEIIAVVSGTQPIAPDVLLIDGAIEIIAEIQGDYLDASQVQEMLEFDGSLKSEKFKIVSQG